MRTKVARVLPVARMPDAAAFAMAFQPRRRASPQPKNKAKPASSRATVGTPASDPASRPTGNIARTTVAAMPSASPFALVLLGLRPWSRGPF